MNNIDLNIFKATLPKTLPEQGCILISEPFLESPIFSRSIILITEHNSEGTIGFVLNKPSEIYPDELFDDVFSFNGVLHIGGPVSTNTLHFIHTLGDKVSGAIKITPSIYWGGDFDIVKKMINSGMADSRSIRFFVGYSGWSAGQLENEIEENSWVVSKLDDNKIMNADSNKSWHEILNGFRGIYKTWSNFPRHPSFN